MKVPHYLKVLKRKILSNKYGKWYIAQKDCDIFRKSIDRLNEGYFTGDKTETTKHKRVVLIYDNKKRAFGLADRLRSIISIYKTCEELDIDFKILFTHPFNLSRYLQPNVVDWEISKEDLCYNLNSTDICCLEMRTGTDFEIAQHEKWFKKELKKKYSEFHIRTNTAYSFKYDFAGLFNKLFKPSPLLLDLMREHLKKLGNEYISVSFRFLDLLGDFNEPDSTNGHLSEKQQKELIKRNVEQIEMLHNKYPDTRILVNSDSCTFLEAAKKMEYTYIVPGNIEHVDNTVSNAEEAHDKTLIDFFLIAHAKEVYLFITGDMYNSNFPYAASKLYNKPFNRIYF